MAKRISRKLRGTIRNVDDDPYIKLLRFQRKNLEEFGEQLQKLEEIKLKIAEYACEKIRDIANEGLQKIADELQIGQEMLGSQYTDSMQGRKFAEFSFYNQWMNEYYDLFNRRRFLQSRNNSLRRNNWHAWWNRVEIANNEREIGEIDDLLPALIHRINTHYTYDISRNDRQYITIENSNQQNENNRNIELPANIVLQTISDWGPVISLTFYATGLFKIGLVIDGITIAADWTPIINDLIQTGDWNKFIQDVAGWSASYLIRRSAYNIATRNLTRGLREDEIAKNIGRALGTLVEKLADRLIETMNWVN